MLRSVVMFKKKEPSRSLQMKTFLLNTCVDPGQVGQIIPLHTTRVKTLVAEKHVITKLHWFLCNYQLDAFDSWRLHESEIEVQGSQRFFFLAASQLIFATSRKEEKSRKPLGPEYNRDQFSREYYLYGHNKFAGFSVDQHL